MLFQAPELDDEEKAVLGRIEKNRTSMAYQVRDPQRWTGLLRKDLFARAIRGSNSIEGYNVSASDALAAAEGSEPLEADEAAWDAVTGYRTAMTYILQLADDEEFSYSDALLRSLHFMMISYDLKKHPGRWRPGAIYVRDDETGEIVYEGPEPEQVPPLVSELVDELNARSDLPLIVKAGMAHLNLAMIHPFSDGNGRMARAVETLVLARGGLLAPQFSSIEEWLGRNTPAYYAVLAEVGAGHWQPERDTRPWVRFVIRAHYQQTLTLLRRGREARRLSDLLEDAVSRLGLPERSIVPLFITARGYVITNATYRMHDEISQWQATRDLKKLVDDGLLMPHGSKRGRYYVASDGLKAYWERSKEAREPIPDPFTA